MFLSAFWSGTDEDQLADQPTVLGGDLLGDAAAEGKAQQVDFGEAEQVDKGDRVSGHRWDTVGRLAARTPDPGLVESDHLTIVGQGRHRGGSPPADVARTILHTNHQL